MKSRTIGVPVSTQRRSASSAQQACVIFALGTAYSCPSTTEHTGMPRLRAFPRGEFSDIQLCVAGSGMVTIPNIHPVTALQVLSPDGKWCWVKHIDNDLVPPLWAPSPLIASWSRPLRTQVVKAGHTIEILSFQGPSSGARSNASFSPPQLARACAGTRNSARITSRSPITRSSSCSSQRSLLCSVWASYTSSTIPLRQRGAVDVWA